MAFNITVEFLYIFYSSKNTEKNHDEFIIRIHVDFYRQVTKIKYIYVHTSETEDCVTFAMFIQFFAPYTLFFCSRAGQ